MPSQIHASKQEKGRALMEKLAKNDTIVVVTIIKLASFRSFVKDFPRSLLNEHFLRVPVLSKQGPSIPCLKIVDRTLIQRCFYKTTGEEFHKSLKLNKNSVSPASFLRKSTSSKSVDFHHSVQILPDFRTP